MSKLVLKSEVDAPVGSVWQAVRQLSATSGWPMGGGQPSQLDEAGRLMTYSIDTPFLAEACRVEMRVRDDGRGATIITWTGLFTVRGEQEMALVKVLHRTLHDQVAQFERLLSGLDSG